MTIVSGIGERAFKPERPLNAAVADSVMVGVAKRLELGELGDVGALRDVYERLMIDEGYRRGVDRATADEESVKTRLAKATEAFRVVR